MLFVNFNRLVKPILFVLALQVINMSIDVPVNEVRARAATEDYNFIDSYVEFITEVIFKYENAIPESKHRHQAILKTHQQLHVICQQIFIAIPAITNISLVQGYPHYINHYAFRFVKEFNHPPSFS